MRKIISAIFFILVAQSAMAMSNETLYKDCKLHARNGFSLAESEGDLELISQSYCEGYMLGIIEKAQNICNFFKSSKTDSSAEFQDRWRFAAYAFGTSAKNDNLHAIILSFINWAEDNPEKWSYTPHARDWLYQKWPCDID